MKNSFIIPIISDIHWGRPNIDQKDYNEMMYYLIIDRLKSLPHIDFLVITGDYWDRTLRTTDDGFYYGFLFFSKLLDLAVEKNFKIRVIAGTKSHDDPYMLNYYHILNRQYNADLKTYQSVDKEDLDGLSILYIPEEYINDFDNHYSEFFKSKEYDLVFGHGLIDKASFVASMQESESTSLKAPIFKVDDLLNISKGPTFFGHIHKPMSFEDRVYYVGSPSRFAFGEEEAKGFVICYYSKDNNNHKIEFIENKAAPKYTTLSYTYDGEIPDSEFVDNIANDYNTTIESLTIRDFIRIKITVKDLIEMPKSLILNLQTTYGTNLLLKFNTRLKQEKERDSRKNYMVTELGFLLDNNVLYHEKISKYLMKKKNKELEPERIKEILYEKYLK